MKIAVCLLVYLWLGVKMPKEYANTYYSNGVKMSCGWLQNNHKTGYWNYFYQNSQLESEGHYNAGVRDNYWSYYYPNSNIKMKGAFKGGLKNGYWFFYNKEGKLTKEGHYTSDKPEKWWKYYKAEKFEKCIYQSDGKTRYCLIYINGKLKMGSKYTNDTLIKEWKSITSFRKDNPNFKF